MHILHLSTDDTGGAGKVALRLHTELNHRGIKSTLLVLNKTVADPLVIAVQPPNNLFGIASRIWRNIKRILLPKRILRTDANYNFFDAQTKVEPVPSQYLFQYITEKPDAIIVHWISRFLDIKNLYDLQHKYGVPIFWYLMDMAPFTGGCHYAWDCPRYTQICGQCPALYSKVKKDKSYYTFKKKAFYLQKTSLTVIAGTQWLHKQASVSALFKNKPIEKIMIGLDNTIFRPFDKPTAQKVFGIPEGKKVIFVGATSLNEPRKGGAYLLQSLQSLTSMLSQEEIDNVFVLIAGKDNSLYNSLPMPYKCVHYFQDDRLLALAYQASHIFACPSIEDSGPMMINEAIMCGIPVVSFEMGVALDLVHSGQTGYRAVLKDSNDFAKGLSHVLKLSTQGYSIMAKNCQELGMRLCSTDQQIAGILKLIAQPVN